MRAALDSSAAVKRIAGLVEGAVAEAERRVFYPYYHFGARGRLRWLFGERRLEFDCLVDARTGRAASADALALDTLTVDDAEVLGATHEAVEAEPRARRYARHALGKGFRLLGDFNLELDCAGLVHRPYWIVRTGTSRVLVDAVTGDLHPLAAADRTM